MQIFFITTTNAPREVYTRASCGATITQSAQMATSTGDLRCWGRSVLDLMEVSVFLRSFPFRIWHHGQSSVPHLEVSIRLNPCAHSTETPLACDSGIPQAPIEIKSHAYCFSATSSTDPTDCKIIFHTDTELFSPPEAFRLLLAD